MIRAPVAPIGWPRAMPPPLTLVFSCGTSSLRIQASTTGANASLHPEEVDVVDRQAGPVQGVPGRADRSGQHPDRVVTAHREVVDARLGASPCSRTAAAEAISRRRTRQICEATAAVIRPPGARGSSPAIFSITSSRAGTAGGQTLPSGKRDRLDLAREPSSAIAVRVAVVRGQRESLHLLADRSHFPRDHLAERNWLTSWSP